MQINCVVRGFNMLQTTIWSESRSTGCQRCPRICPSCHASFSATSRKYFPRRPRDDRHFTPAEAAYYIGIGEGYLRQVVSDVQGPEPLANGPPGRRLATWAMSAGRSTKNGTPKYVPIPRAGEKLQVVAVMNFKGGSAKTTTSAHLAPYPRCAAIAYWQSIWILRPRCRALRPST